MLEIKNFGLHFGSKVLLQNVDVLFPSNVVNHILGNNGCGKSSFAKSCVGMLPHDGTIQGNEKTIYIGSSSNIPGEFSISDLSKLLQKRFDKQKVESIYALLKMDEISNDLPIKKMSDGQKQKVKLYAFLSAEFDVVILDQFTNALDKASSLELYHFINAFAQTFDVTILNITHNLSDLEYMLGNYYYFSHQNISRLSSKQDAIDCYIKGEQ